MEYGRISSQKIFEKTNQRPMMHPFHFGSLFELFCCFCARCLKDHNKKVTDSIEFYTKNENELKVKIAEYKEKILKKPFGIFFITFEDQTMAAKFLKDYHLGLLGGFLRSTFNDKNRCVNCYICKNLAKTSSLSKELNSDIWSVKYATSPNNIIWENISKYSKYYWWMRVFLINIVLIVLMIFFTTPAILIEKITSWNTFINIKELEVGLSLYLLIIFNSFFAEEFSTHFQFFSFSNCLNINLFYFLFLYLLWLVFGFSFFQPKSNIYFF